MAQCGDDVLIETTFDYTLDCGESGRGSGFQWRSERHLSLTFSEKMCCHLYLFSLTKLCMVIILSGTSWYH